MRSLLVLALLTGPALADPKPQPAKPAKAKVVKKKQPVYEVTAPIVVSSSAPKPGVVYVTTGGKNVTGRPKSDDRLKGMGPQTK